MCYVTIMILIDHCRNSIKIALNNSQGRPRLITIRYNSEINFGIFPGKYLISVHPLGIILIYKDQ
jgi:hypothetical protein